MDKTILQKLFVLPANVNKRTMPKAKKYQTQSITKLTQKQQTLPNLQNLGSFHTDYSRMAKLSFVSAFGWGPAKPAELLSPAEEDLSLKESQI